MVLFITHLKTLDFTMLYTMICYFIYILSWRVRVHFINFQLYLCINK